MGFPESFVGTGVLDCPFRIPPKDGNRPMIQIPVGRGFISRRLVSLFSVSAGASPRPTGINNRPKNGNIQIPLFLPRLAGG